MGAYDSIAVPVKGQPISSGMYGVKVREAILDLDTRMALLEASQELPETVAVGANGTNSITWAGTTWQDLTVNPASAQMTNPSPIFDLVVNVYFGAWLLGTHVRMGLRLSGGVTVATPGIGVANQPAGWGHFPMTTQATEDQHMGLMQVIIPAGAATVTFTAQGYRSSAVASNVNYPTIQVIPERYKLP